MSYTATLFFHTDGSFEIVYDGAHHTTLLFQATDTSQEGLMVKIIQLLSGLYSVKEVESFSTAMAEIAFSAGLGVNSTNVEKPGITASLCIARKEDQKAPILYKV